MVGAWPLGVLAPLVLFPERRFDGPHNAPTLEGRYVIKDLIIVAARLVVASTDWSAVSS